MAFEPFPRRLEPGEELTVEGRFVHGAGKDGGCKLQNPALWLGGPDRRSTRVALALDADCGFVTRVVVPREPGAYLMEITHAPAIARDRRVELHFHTAAQAEIVVGGDEELEPDPGWMRPVDEPPGAGERLAIVRREIERVRAEAGLTGLAENRLATFLLEDQLLRAYHQRRVPTFQDIAAILETHGEGDTSLGFGGALYRVVERLAIRFNDPSVRKVLLDPFTESFGLATDPDGDVFRIVFLGRGEDEGDRGAGADARLGSAPLPVPPRARTGILAPSVVSGIFENQRQRLVKCFRDEAAWVERGYAVEARFEVVVGSTGKVVAARAEGARADPRGFEACVLGVLGKMSFPVPTPSARGPAVVFVSRSLRFTSRGEDKIQLTIGQ